MLYIFIFSCFMLVLVVLLPSIITVHIPCTYGVVNNYLSNSAYVHIFISSFGLVLSTWAFQPLVCLCFECENLSCKFSYSSVLWYHLLNSLHNQMWMMLQLCPISLGVLMWNYFYPQDNYIYKHMPEYRLSNQIYWTLIVVICYYLKLRSKNGLLAYPHTCNMS